MLELLLHASMSVSTTGMVGLMANAAEPPSTLSTSDCNTCKR